MRLWIGILTKYKIMWMCWVLGHDWRYKLKDEYTYREEGFTKTMYYYRKACNRCGKPNPNYVE